MQDSRCRTRVRSLVAKAPMDTGIGAKSPENTDIGTKALVVTGIVAKTPVDTGMVTKTLTVTGIIVAKAPVDTGTVTKALCNTDMDTNRPSDKAETGGHHRDTIGNSHLARRRVTIPRSGPKTIFGNYICYLSGA